MSPGGLLYLIAALAAQGQRAEAERTDRSCLAQAIYYEARGESERGQAAIAEVILHRVRMDTRHPSICAVVYEPHQFSFVDDGSMLRKLDANAWLKADNLALRIMRGDLATSFTRGAMFYHASDIHPEWTAKLVRTAQIGRHVFYQLPRRTHSTL